MWFHVLCPGIAGTVWVYRIFSALLCLSGWKHGTTLECEEAADVYLADSVMLLHAHVTRVLAAGVDAECILRPDSWR